MNNPYNDMINMIQRQGKKFNPPTIQVGKVNCEIPNLIIQIGELQIDKDNLLIADNLIQEGYLKIDDKVAVIPTLDRKYYIILAKVVSLNG